MKNNKTKDILVTIFVIIQVALIVCRINEFIEISWWIVFVPILTIPFIILSTFIGAFLYHIITDYLNRRKVRVTRRKLRNLNKKAQTIIEENG